MEGANRYNKLLNPFLSFLGQESYDYNLRRIIAL